MYAHVCVSVYGMYENVVKILTAASHGSGF